MPLIAPRPKIDPIKSAWDEYLERCRSAQYTATPNRWQYEEIEEWAWDRLQQRLRSVEKQRRER